MSVEKRSTSAKAMIASSPRRTSIACTPCTPPQQQSAAASARTSAIEAAGLGVGRRPSPPSMVEESRRGVRSTYGGGAVCGSRSSSERSSPTPFELWSSCRVR